MCAAAVPEPKAADEPAAEPALPVSNDAMEEAKRKRAERFGVPLVESKPEEPAGGKGGKGKGKGGGKGGGGKGGGELSEEDKARIAAREARFGKMEEAPGGKKRPVEQVAPAPVDPEEEERRKKRAARFGQA